jgi:hypothetical protein
VGLKEIVRLVAFVILILGLTARRLEAQRAAPIAVGPSLSRETRSPLPGATLPAPRDTSSSRASVLRRNALIGAGVGAVSGLVTAVIVTHTGNYSNHADDGLLYMYFPIYGAMAGLVAGLIVGVVQIL